MPNQRTNLPICFCVCFHQYSTSSHKANFAFQTQTKIIHKRNSKREKNPRTPSVRLRNDFTKANDDKGSDNTKRETTQKIRLTNNRSTPTIRGEIINQIQTFLIKKKEKIKKQIYHRYFYILSLRFQIKIRRNQETNYKYFLHFVKYSKENNRQEATKGKHKKE